jgi:hypothetical protein
VVYFISKPVTNVPGCYWFVILRNLTEYCQRQFSRDFLATGVVAGKEFLQFGKRENTVRGTDVADATGT